jgi:hypothetical protein
MEMIVFIFVLVMLFAVLIPQLVRTSRAAKLRVCADNLKQVVLAHLLYVNDHEFVVFPGQVSTNEGGTIEHLQSGELFQHFKRFTNEFVEGLPNTNEPASPRVLVCPSDNRKAAKSFGTLGNSNLSYFVNADIGQLSGAGLQPLDRAQNYIAIGDRNVTNSAALNTWMVSVAKTNQLGWDSRMHNKGRNSSQPSVGNVALADGSVKTLTSTELRQAFTFVWPETSRLILP